MIGKPWRGPLPPVCSTKLVSLGELRVTDRRGGGGTPISFLSELEEDLGVHRRAPVRRRQGRRLAQIRLHFLNRKRASRWAWVDRM
jgi:hypothetical protein